MNRKISDRLYEIIFEADTREGKAFDIFILLLIILSVVAVSLNSVQSLHEKYLSFFLVFEWVVTIVFTVEYILRIAVLRHPWAYIISFFGIIDLLAILPSYLEFVIIGGHNLVLIRTLRLLRIFRIFKLSRYLFEQRTLAESLRRSSARIMVFLISVFVLTIVFGSIMYLIEDSENGFTSIPQSIYWAIVTITTVGYGDIAPVTTIGKAIAGFMMLLGYAIIAVPTGIITADLVFKNSKRITTQVCPDCTREGHDSDAIHCKYCGAELNPDEEKEN